MNAEPQKIENLTEAFQVFKTNLNHIQSLSDFSSTLDGFKENVERIDLLSKEIETIKESISDTLKKEDLDTAMMSHLLFVEESIENIQGKIKGLNSKTLYNIKEEFGELEETVSDFIRLDVPSYKKQILDSERRIDTRFFDFKNQIKEEVISIDSHLTEKLSTISETISSINESHLNEFRNEVSVLENKVDDALENELPRYKRFFTETKLKTEEKIKNVTDFVESKVDTLENDYQNQIQNLNSLVKDFTEQEIPKYRSLITESKLQVEKDFITLEESIQNKIQQIDESIKSLIKDTHHQNQENDLKVTNQLLDLQKIVESSKNQINTISNTYENLYKDFRNREIHENQKLESYEVLLNDFSEKINVLENNLNDNVSLLHEDLNISTSKYYDVLKKEVGYFEENISNKVKDLEVNIVVNEKHIKDIQNSVYDVLDNLKLDLIEEKSQELTEKISYVESILEKFNEKTILNEGLLNEPPTVKNSDPLTPLDQNYVTLDQLQNHYRQFINRVQIQLASIGGGGETRLEFLDDIDRSTAKIDGRFLKYDAASDKWIGAVGGGGGSQTLDDTLGLGNTSSIGMSVGIVTATSFIGSGSNLTGIVTSITAGSGISIDQSTGNVTITATGGSGGGESYWTSTSSGIHTLSNVGIGTTAKSDFKLFVEGDARITGILTVGSQSVTIDGSNNTIKVGSGITIDGNTGIISASAVYIAGSQVSTFSGNYNDLTNKPDLSSISVAYASTAGIATYATNAGIATYATSSGIATYATNAGVATALQNSRTFEITGDIVASAITFNGTGNVSLAATIQPNSVALGGDTTGDYVQSITGTSNQITVTGGTGESSTPTLSLPIQVTIPQDLTVLRDVQIDRNLNVNGNITIGGTSGTLFTETLKISDSDIVLGFRTDGSGNDVSNDTTANHGGIAVASTEGTPLVNFNIVGIETLPPTYKKIMWFKAGEFAGLGTDAWLMNYAVGIGSTQFPTGTRLAAGNVQFTQNDLAAVRNINASGVVTSTTFVGALTGTATSTTNIPNLTGDITSNNTTTTLATVNSNVGTYGDAGAIPSITVNAKGLVTGVTTVAPNNGQLSLAVSGTGLSGSATFTANQSGSSTFTVTSNATEVNTPSTIVARDASGNFSAGTIAANLTGTATTATNLADATNITTGTINSARLSGTYNINVSYASTSGIATVAQGLTGTPNITVGIVTATSFVKSGGTSSQFLKADGSIDTNTYLTTTGSGTNLTGIVTSITAGSGISVNQSTGNVTITATGGGGSTLGIATAGGTVGTGVTLLDFRGAGISTVTVSSGIATINIEGGGSSTPEISSVMMSMIF